MTSASAHVIIEVNCFLQKERAQELSKNGAYKWRGIHCNTSVQ